MFTASRRRKYFNSIEWTPGRVAAGPSTLGSCDHTTIEGALNNTPFWGQIDVCRWTLLSAARQTSDERLNYGVGIVAI
jgi:hypothetical protein